MPYYHIYIATKTKTGTRDGGFLYNFRREEVTKAVAVPYMENRAIHFSGRFIYPADIDMIEIFESEEPFHKLITPNGKSPVDTKNPNYVYSCLGTQRVKGFVRVCTHDFITSPPKEKKEPRLMEYVSFLGLNTNWSSATCALQLQEVAVTLVAKKKKIKLDKTNVERILKKKIKGELSFNDRYRAFSKQVKDSFKIEMPRLAAHLRKMRTEVLHQGYNPTPEETESITSFTIGLLKKLDSCIEKPLPYIHLQN